MILTQATSGCLAMGDVLPGNHFSIMIKETNPIFLQYQYLPLNADKRISFVFSLPDTEVSQSASTLDTQYFVTDFFKCTEIKMLMK